MPAAASPRTLDHEGRREIVIFGVTGVTGKIVLENALDRLQCSQIAIAGRSSSKINNILSQLKKEFPQHEAAVSDVEVVEADVANYSSLVAMCRTAKVVLNCVGPFRFYGEEVVKAAIEAKTHYMDICGEPMFLETIEAKWNDVARREGLWIIGSCAFDSIPGDLGVVQFQKDFPGELTGVEAFLSGDPGPSGYTTNDATWQAAIHGFASQEDLKKFRKGRGLDSIRYYGPRLPNYGSYFKSREHGYCVPFLGSDASVVARTQRQLANRYRMDPVRFKPYVILGRLKNLILMMIFGTIFSIFAKYNFTRSLLQKFPSFFSAGFFSKGGPTKKQMLEATFTWYFKGYGFISPYERDNSSSKQPTVNANFIFRGPDAAYIGTSIMFLEAALTLLNTPQDLPDEGGVYTPGIAFKDTNLIERLRKSGFQIGITENRNGQSSVI